MINKNTQLLIQGITGKEGARAARWMLDYGTKILAGVTPGKGGQEVEGIPVYNTIKEALVKHPEINASSIYVPPRFVKGAFDELASEVGQDFLVHILAEGVPIHDTASIIQLAQAKDIRVVGPSSIGIIRPGIAKIGSIGGPTNDSFEKGSVAVISKSGGLASEVSLILKKESLGQSLVIGTGGDILVGSTFHDFFANLQQDDQTKAIVIVGEVGGTYEQQAAQAVKDGKTTKPVVAFVSGLFTETMPRGTAIGHAGAIIEGKSATRDAKIKALRDAGVTIAETLDQIGKLVKEKIK